MRIIVLTGGSPATVFALAPVATAARLAGHVVVVAAPAGVVSHAAAVGLPAVSVTDGTMRQFMFTSRGGKPLELPVDEAERLLFNGRGFGRLAAAELPALRELARDFAPDLVVGGSLCYAAALLAHELDVPFVRHTWDLGEPSEMDLGAAEELRPELDVLGLDTIPAARLWVDVCPPSLRTGGPGPRQNMRFVPFNEQRPLNSPTYRRGDRPRVCVTAGSRVSHDDEVAYLAGLIASIGALDVDIAVAAPEAVADAVQTVFPRVRAGWFPLDTLLPTCDLLVHHGGGQTALTALDAGIPQLLIPNIPKMVPPCTRIADAGAGITLAAGDGSSSRVTGAAHELLDEPRYRRAAGVVRAENAGQPTPPDVVTVLESLVAARQ